MKTTLQELATPDPWHALSAEQVAYRLETGAGGLTESEARRRLQRYGPNRLEEAKPVNPLLVLLHQFQSPLIYILVLAAVVTFWLGDTIDSIVIAAVLLVNALIGFIQEYRAEHAIRALTRLAVPKARVVRDGHEREIESGRLVPGDLVLLETGMRVPADIRLVAATALQVDESLLTGESVPVLKQVAPVPAATPLADRVNMVYSGTVITAGRGRGYVVATGASSELGKIAHTVHQQAPPETPLQMRMRQFAGIIAIVTGISCGVILALGIVLGNTPLHMFKVVVGVAVAAIPEGLPIVMTIALALSVHRMARRNALVRQFAAVETLGSTTTIGSDKTGTLTENRMTVQEYWVAEEVFRIEELEKQGLPESDEHPFILALLTGILTNEAEVEESEAGYEIHGDPTEAALLIAALRIGVAHRVVRERHPVVGEIPFEPELQYSASVREHGGEQWVFVKGAPERLFRMATHWLTRDGERALDETARQRIQEQARQMAGRGLRVLGLAYRRLPEPLEPTERVSEPTALVFIGLVGMMDPPRPGVKEAIDDCHRAGIRVLMITGDHAETARAIGRELDLTADDAPVLTGADLDQMDETTLREQVKRVAIFARVSPEHKLRIVHALRANGEVVAMTGDGVNDAPALKAADVGIAMGKSGTDVAREAADIVLTDDNFISIRNAVEEGRIAFSNLRNATFFLLSTGAASVLIFFLTLLTGLPIPLLPAQLLWLNLVTNGLQDVALAFESGERGVMTRPPRPRNEGIISPLLWERTVIVGILIAGATYALFRWELENGGSLSQAQTVALTTLVLFQNFHVGNCRSEYRSALFLSPLRNPFLLLAALSALSAHTAALYLPWTQFILRVEPIGLEEWTRMVLVALSVVVVVELHKWLRHPLRARTG